MKISKKVLLNEIIPSIAGMVMINIGAIIGGIGLYKRGYNQSINDIAHDVFDEGELSGDFYDNAGKVYCITCTYDGD